MNRLAQESSPYLLQHKDNPVDWYPWSTEALQRAKTEEKPIFLSIGYSACHWCHVMEHESFENEPIAAFLNQHFICIKVDREERPDLDHIYMQAVQMITGRGGWPLSAFLTPDLQPFYGGTYWPPSARMGMPGFDEVLSAVINAWTDRRDLAIQQAVQLTTAIRNARHDSGDPATISLDLFPTAKERLAASFDSVHGGFGRAPKFPRPIELQMLLRTWHRDHEPKTLEMVCLTLDKMAAGGMYDHLAGGFARYSVDNTWLVPHFEKMLYDNALLSDAYLDGYLATGNARYAQVARESLDYILSDMVDPDHGFHSTEDADSEGEEGKYYVWTVNEIDEVLGEEQGRRFCDVYGVTRQGNFEGKNILNLAESVKQTAATWKCDPAELAEELHGARQRLLEQRKQRVRPSKDDKILVSWNALMIHTLARAAGILHRPNYLEAAQRAATFLLTKLRRSDGRLLHCWRQGQAKLDAYLDDYTYLANALVTLYESDGDERWIDEAAGLCDTVLQHFADTQQGGFFFTADDHEELAARTKEWHDASVPSSNAMAATALLRLGLLTGRTDLLAAATDTLQAAAGLMRSTPEAASQMLIAADLLVGPTTELVLLNDTAHDEAGTALNSLRSAFLPRTVLAQRTASPSRYHSPLLADLFHGKSTAAGQPTLFVCQGFACQKPISGTDEIAAWVAAQRQRSM